MEVRPTENGDVRRSGDVIIIDVPTPGDSAPERVPRPVPRTFIQRMALRACGRRPFCAYARPIATGDADTLILGFVTDGILYLAPIPPAKQTAHLLGATTHGPHTRPSLLARCKIGQILHSDAAHVAGLRLPHNIVRYLMCKSIQDSGMLSLRPLERQPHPTRTTRGPTTEPTSAVHLTFQFVTGREPRV